jgi:hypothetical protein
MDSVGKNILNNECFASLASSPFFYLIMIFILFLFFFKKKKVTRF